MNNAELVQRADGIEFPVLRLGTKISAAGAVYVAHEVTLLRELLSRREGDLYDRVHDAIQGEVGFLAEILGIEKDDPGYWVQKIVKEIMERMLVPDDEHSTSDPRAVLLELIEEAEKRELASSR